MKILTCITITFAVIFGLYWCGGGDFSRGEGLAITLGFSVGISSLLIILND